MSARELLCPFSQGERREVWSYGIRPRGKNLCLSWRFRFYFIIIFKGQRLLFSQGIFRLGRGWGPRGPLTSLCVYQLVSWKLPGCWAKKGSCLVGGKSREDSLVFGISCLAQSCLTECFWIRLFPREVPHRGRVWGGQPCPGSRLGSPSLPRWLRHSPRSLSFPCKCSPDSNFLTNLQVQLQLLSSRELDEVGDIKKRETEDRKRVERKQGEFGFPF